jgi:hypothetical protein
MLNKSTSRKSITPKRCGAKKTIFAGLLVGLFLAAACGQADKVPLVGGSWAVIRHQAPGFSAMSKEEADSWVGKAAEYTNEKASFDGRECVSPVYKPRPMRGDEFYSGFRAAPESLGYEGGSIHIVEVYCGGSRWTNPGGTLVRVGKNKLFLFWDGIFFQLNQQSRAKN